MEESKGLFYFDATYRPCSLQQQFVGVTEKKAIKHYQVMNEVCYEKVLDQAGKNQTLVFIHLQKETAKFIHNRAIEKETITQFVRPDSATHEILNEEANNIKDGNLKDLLPFGFAIHHAGMTKEDCGLVEELFTDGFVQVLVCTAMITWGVNGSSYHHRMSSRCLAMLAARSTIHTETASLSQITQSFNIVPAYSINTFQSSPNLFRNWQII